MSRAALLLLSFCCALPAELLNAEAIVFLTAKAGAVALFRVLFFGHHFQHLLLNGLF
jgi:hypothetical protein